MPNLTNMMSIIPNKFYICERDILEAKESFNYRMNKADIDNEK